MECKDAEKLIPEFLDSELDVHTMEKFLKHVDECPECMEELSIQYLITEGTLRLEDGGTFDLSKELNELLEDCKDWIYMMHCKKIVKLSCMLIGVITLVSILAMVIVI